MTVYLFVYLLCVLLWWYLGRCREKKIIIAVVYACIFWVSTLRSIWIGADYERYTQIWNGGYGGYGIGYQYLNKAAHLFGNSYIWLAFTVNLVIFLLAGMAYRKELDEQYQAVALTLWILNPYCFIQSSFNILRQGCAMAIVLAGACYLIHELSKKKNSLKKYLIFSASILIAGSFHKSAYLFIGLLPFTWIPWKRSYHIILASLCIIMNLFTFDSQFMYFFAKTFHYDNYLVAESSIFDHPVYTIFIAGVIIFLLCKYSSLYSSEKEKWFIDLYLLSLSLLLLFVKNDQAYRVYVYFSYITMISVAIIIKNMERKSKKGVVTFSIKTGCFLYYTCLYWSFILLQAVLHNGNYYPFRFFWQTV